MTNTKTTKKKCCANCAWRQIDYSVYRGSGCDIDECRKHKRKGRPIMLGFSMARELIRIVYCDKYKEAKK